MRPLCLAVLLNLAAIDGQGLKYLRLLFGVSICLTYPTMHFAARRSLDQMLFHSSVASAPYPRLLAETVCIVGSTLLLGLYAERVETVLAWTGAMGSTTVLYVLPPCIVLRLSPRSWSQDMGALLFLALGLSFGVLGCINLL